MVNSLSFFHTISFYVAGQPSTRSPNRWMTALPCSRARWTQLLTLYVGNVASGKMRDLCSAVPKIWWWAMMMGDGDNDETTTKAFWRPKTLLPELSTSSYQYYLSYCLPVYCDPSPSKHPTLKFLYLLFDLWLFSKVKHLYFLILWEGLLPLFGFSLYLQTNIVNKQLTRKNFNRKHIKIGKTNKMVYMHVI